MSRRRRPAAVVVPAEARAIRWRDSAAIGPATTTEQTPSMGAQKHCDALVGAKRRPWSTHTLRNGVLSRGAQKPPDTGARGNRPSVRAGLTCRTAVGSCVAEGDGPALVGANVVSMGKTDSGELPNTDEAPGGKDGPDRVAVNVGQGQGSRASGRQRRAVETAASWSWGAERRYRLGPRFATRPCARIRAQATRIQKNSTSLRRRPNSPEHLKLKFKIRPPCRGPDLRGRGGAVPVMGIYR